jgi:hypothetical protein
MYILSLLWLRRIQLRIRQIVADPTGSESSILIIRSRKIVSGYGNIKENKESAITFFSLFLVSVFF